VLEMGNKYFSIENLLMRPYGRIGGIKGFVNKILGVVFRFIRLFYSQIDTAPLGVAVIIEKNS
jgi:hypothetical protein